MPRFKTLDLKTGRWFGLFLGILYIALALMEGEERARALGVSFGVLFALGYIAWDFRKDQKFWLVMTSLAVVHVMISILVPWKERRVPGFFLVPIFIGDFYVCFSLAYFVLMRSNR